VVDIYFHGYASDEPEVIDLTGDDDDDNDHDSDSEAEFSAWVASLGNAGVPVRNLGEEMNGEV
jgi:hypothetical protein